MAVPEGSLCEHALELHVNGRTFGLSTFTVSLEGA